MSNFICRLFGHKYKLITSDTVNYKEYKCTNCKNLFTLDDNGEITRLTPKMQKVNKALNDFYEKRRSRKEYATPLEQKSSSLVQ